MKGDVAERGWRTDMQGDVIERGKRVEVRRKGVAVGEVEGGRGGEGPASFTSSPTCSFLA